MQAAEHPGAQQKAPSPRSQASPTHTPAKPAGHAARPSPRSRKSQRQSLAFISWNVTRRCGSKERSCQGNGCDLRHKHAAQAPPSHKPPTWSPRWSNGCSLPSWSASRHQARSSVSRHQARRSWCGAAQQVVIVTTQHCFSLCCEQIGPLHLHAAGGLVKVQVVVLVGLAMSVAATPWGIALGGSLGIARGVSWIAR